MNIRRMSIVLQSLPTNRDMTREDIYQLLEYLESLERYGTNWYPSRRMAAQYWRRLGCHCQVCGISIYRDWQSFVCLEVLGIIDLDLSDEERFRVLDKHSGVLHHVSYGEPETVIPVCDKCHRWIHSNQPGSDQWKPIDERPAK